MRSRPWPRLANRCGTPAGTQVASPASRSKRSSPTTAAASPSRTSTLSSTLWVCRGMAVPGSNTVIPVVTRLPSAFHLPTYGIVTTPAPRSNRSTCDARMTIGASAIGQLQRNPDLPGEPLQVGEGARRQVDPLPLGPGAGAVLDLARVEHLVEALGERDRLDLGD